MIHSLGNPCAQKWKPTKSELLTLVCTEGTHTIVASLCPFFIREHCMMKLLLCVLSKARRVEKGVSDRHPDMLTKIAKTASPIINQY